MGPLEEKVYVWESHDMESCKRSAYCSKCTKKVLRGLGTVVNASNAPKGKEIGVRHPMGPRGYRRELTRLALLRSQRV